MKCVLAIALLAAAGSIQAGAGSLLHNGGFEVLDARGGPQDWSLKQHAGVRGYEFALDDDAFHGKYSMRITRLQKQVWGTVEQNIPAAGLVGKVVEFSVRVRGRDVGTRGFSVALGGYAGSTMLQHVKSKPIAGSSDWSKVELRIEVPEGSTQVMVGVTLNDAGSVWIDDARLRVVKPRS